MIAIGSEERWHLELAQRWIIQYNFYINDQRWGRMFVRMCPYLPFSARVCLNQHYWLANQMRQAGIDFKQCSVAITAMALSNSMIRDHLLLRTEPATNNVTDYGLKKAVENLPQLRQKLTAICDHYLSVQQDILETFLDRGPLRILAQPTVLANGKRIPGLKLDHPRQLALMHALVRFAHVAAGNTFRTCELQAPVAEALGCTLSQYRLCSLRYDLFKLRAKGLLEKIPHSSRYRLLPQGYSICVVFLKLFERIYAPLTAAVLAPFSADTNLPHTRRSQLDRLYARVASSLEKLLQALGLKAA